MQNVHFTPPELAPIFGVNVSTIKRWVDKGILKADKTPGGHRRVSKENLYQFIKEHAKVSDQSYALRQLSKMNSGELSWDKYFRLLFNNKIKESNEYIRNLFIRNVDLIKIVEEVIFPTLREIGQRWQSGQLDIHEEHRMSFIVSEHINYISSLIPDPKRSKGKVLITCAPGDNHIIPAQILNLIFRKKGWEPIVLGINTPVSEIKKAREKFEPKIICVSGTYTEKNLKTYLDELSKISVNKIICGGSIWDKFSNNTSKKILFPKNISDLEELI